MKLFIYCIFVFTSFFASIEERNIDCEKFKKGTFYHKLDGDTTLYRIERNDTIQKETMVRTGDYITLKISWVAPCEYDLTFLSQHISLTDSISTEYQGLKLKSRIVNIRNDSCFLETFFVGDTINKPIKGILYLLK